MRAPQRWRFWTWMAWLGFFVVFEVWAIFDRAPGDTLSESIWFLQRGFWPLTVGLGVLSVFLFVHFVLDKRSRK